jgi:hypothetical protein
MHDMITYSLTPAVGVLSKAMRGEQILSQSAVDTLRKVNLTGLSNRMIAWLKTIPPERLIAVLSLAIQVLMRYGPLLLADEDEYTEDEIIDDLMSGLGSILQGAAPILGSIPGWGMLLGPAAAIGGVAASQGSTEAAKKKLIAKAKTVGLTCSAESDFNPLDPIGLFSKKKKKKKPEPTAKPTSMAETIEAMRSLMELQQEMAEESNEPELPPTEQYPQFQQAITPYLPSTQPQFAGMPVTGQSYGYPTAPEYQQPSYAPFSQLSQVPAYPGVPQYTPPYVPAPEFQVPGGYTPTPSPSVTVVESPQFPGAYSPAPAAPPQELTRKQRKAARKASRQSDDQRFRRLVSRYNTTARRERYPTVDDVLADALNFASTPLLNDCDCNGCANSRVLHDAEPFFESSWVRARFENDMPNGLFGQVDVSRRPFEVKINRNVPLPRAQVSFTHEMLHTFDRMLKLNLPHEQIHSAAVMLVSEVLPGLNAMTQAYNK